MRLSTESIYETLIDEEDARACADIPESACRETPRNFVLILVSQLLTKLGDAIASPKIVLPWVMSVVQAPVVFTGLLVPVRESGSLIPQLAIGGWVRRFAIRKWFWVVGSVAQAACVVGMGLVALALDGVAAGAAILALLVVFSLARGVCSVASKDVIGKTVPKRRRGRLTGWATSFAGFATVLVGVVLLLAQSGADGGSYYGSLLLLAGCLWLAGAVVFSRIAEFDGETDGGRNAVSDAIARMSLLVTDAPFRRFVATRALLLCSALSAPYYVLLAREQPGAADSLLGYFILAAGIASLVSGPIWGRFADRSSKRVMVGAALISGSIGVAVFAAVELAPTVTAHPAFFPLAYFILSVAHDGARVGRKTYVVDLAGGNKRTDYVSVSNTVIGIVLLVAGLSGALSSVLEISSIVLVLSLFGLAGAWLGTRLKAIE
ncbi:MAG TPA: MFS transporter [Gammaproteobacteria bacterium]|nr:MFS transporter [Gammaproteobacteria bacterium]